MIDVERHSGHSTPWHFGGNRLLRRVTLLAVAIVTVCGCTVFSSTRLAFADQLSSAKAKAAQIEAELASSQAQMSALGQQYDQAETQLQTIDAQIASTQAKISQARKQVSIDKVALEKAAINSYMDAGQNAQQNPLFSGNQSTIEAQNEYSQVAQGDVATTMANLHTSELQLSSDQTSLHSQQSAAQNEVRIANQAIAGNNQQQAIEAAALSQEKGQIATLVQQQQQAAAAAAAAATAAKILAAQQAAAQHVNQPVLIGPTGAQSSYAASNQAAAPPTSPGGVGAVQAAESQLGVPYVWGGESPKGSASPGFDCSGLTAWSWGQVGVPLPHYSGAQMADSTPVPLNDLQPGDLLFYGPGGSQHVAMYTGPGMMIEAPQPGGVVWNTPLRLGGNFVGAGRP